MQKESPAEHVLCSKMRRLCSGQIEQIREIRDIPYLYDGFKNPIQWKKKLVEQGKLIKRGEDSQTLKLGISLSMIYNGVDFV